MSKPTPVIPPAVDWPVRTVGEMTTLLRRGTAPEYVGESHVMAIGQRCITDVDFDGSRSRPHSARAMSKVVRPETNDVLINSTGTGTIGRSVIFRDKASRYIVDGYVTVARPRQTDLVSRWLNDVLRSPAAQRYLEAKCYAGSTNQVELSASALASMPIAIPLVDEQQRVGLVLDTLDHQIRTTEQVISKLEAAKRAVIEDQMGRADLHQPLNQIADLQVGFAFSSKDFIEGDEGVRLLRGENVGYGRPDWSELRSLKRSMAANFPGYKLSAGDIIIGMDRTFTKSGMRISVVTESDLPCLLVQRVGRFLPTSVSQEYLLCILESGTYRRRLSASQKGMDIPHLSKAEILNPLIPVVELEMQSRLIRTTSLFRKRIQAEAVALRRLRTLKSGLTSDLLSGHVRVPEETAL